MLYKKGIIIIIIIKMEYISIYDINWGTRWCSWLKYCSTSRQVVGYNPEGIIENFH